MRLIIFDMDGTVCNSWPGMLYCYRETLKKYGREDMPDDEFFSYFTGFLPENLVKMLDLRDDEVDEAVDFFRLKYEEKGHSLSEPFPHILDTIRRLKAEGYRLGVATMTLEKYAEDTLRELGVLECFDVVRGSDEKGLRTKADMIRMCMDLTGIGKEDTLMIGDGFNDQNAAKKADVGFVAASYGYGITKDNCIEYGIEYASGPENVYDSVKRHWGQL